MEDDLTAISLAGLEELRTRIDRGQRENQERYANRYSDHDPGYADSITDDYDGEGAEFTQLITLVHRVRVEIARRKSDDPAERPNDAF